MNKDQDWALRIQPQPGDMAAIRQIVTATGFFTEPEIAVAVELIETRLTQGPSSGYEFVFIEMNGTPVAYSCYGPIACSIHSFDLYWIAVSPECQGKGFGAKVLVETERLIREAGGARVYIETSNRPQYVSTRGFYLKTGYTCEAVLQDFYAPSDDKVIYVKEL
jgi:GNAT superfamily N-acetyltransferase